MSRRSQHQWAARVGIALFGFGAICQVGCTPTGAEPVETDCQTTAKADAVLVNSSGVCQCGHHRPYPVDGRGFSPVDKWLANAPPMEEDAEGSLNPYVLHVINAYPTDGTYPYRCKPLEYDIYNGVTQDIWYRGRVVAKAYPDGSRCSYCCGLTFEILVRALRERNFVHGIDADDFNGMGFYDLFNLLQIWYIEGKGDSPQLGIVSYGLGRAITDWEEAKPGDFCDFSRNNKTGHAVIFMGWTRTDTGEISGINYFASNSKGVSPATEYFVAHGGKILPDWVRLARVGSVKNYTPFDRTKIPLRRAYAP